jgi:hypothetical protein
VKIQITESQLKRLQKVINEANTAVDNLNNLMDPSDFTIKDGYTVVTFRHIILEGDMEDKDFNVRALINRVLFTKEGEQDVTDFAMDWAIIDNWTSDDLPLGYIIKDRVAKVMNAKYLKLIGAEITEYDVIIE